MDDPVRILLVDDHPVVREGLKVVLERFPDLTVVASASTGEQAITVFHNVHPDVVLMDVNLPDMSGIDSMVRILNRMPDAKVILLTSYTADLMVNDALNKGAMGYLTKDADIPELHRAIHAAMKGEHTLSPEAIKSLIKNRTTFEPADGNLTKRELEILALIVKGFSNRDIAEKLSISISTVKAYATKIYGKLQVHSRSEAIAKAISQQIVNLD